MSNVRYVVKHAFQYGEKKYNPGDEFMPGGGKWDKQIIDNPALITVEHTIEPVAARQRGKKAKSNG